MEQIATNETSNYIGNNFTRLNAEMLITLVIPEYVIFVFLVIGVYGMYTGVEISHPLYSVLFINLIFPLCASVINITAYQMISAEKYIMLANAISALCIEFHCNCWCVTSIVRYIYIVHEKWIHDKVPNVRHQSIAAIALTISFFFVLLIPALGYPVYLGKII